MITDILTNVDLQQAIATCNDRVVVVKFTANWCVPCKKIAPVLHQLAEKYQSQFAVFSADVDQAESLVSHFNVRSMPTFIFLYRNRIIHVIKGPNQDLLTQAFTIIAAMLN